MIKIKIPYLLTIIASILLLGIGHKIAVSDIYDFSVFSQDTARARVLNIVNNINLDDHVDEPMPSLGNRITFNAQITSGARKGEIVKAAQNNTGFLKGAQREVTDGASVLLVFTNNEWYFNGFYRFNKLLALGFLFVICVLFFGGKKGFNTILSLAFTCTAIFAVFVPAILSGKNIYVMSLLVCSFITVMTPLIVIGYNEKSLASIAGCAGGVLIAGIISLVMDKVLHLTGIVDEHSRYLVNLPGNLQLNLNAIIFAGIIIGAVGAVMDVSISISSALWEVKEKAKTIKFRELLNSGFNIGRDIMGTMADTLILAYIGCSLSVVLLLSVFSGSFLNLFNSEMIAVEILQALAGSFGILFAMPLTAFFCSVIYLKNTEPEI
ncbi:MAG: YibE/F family protein [Treponema sp.]|nr:YibE/F family protein [Treponema sp.]